MTLFKTSRRALLGLGIAVSAAAALGFGTTPARAETTLKIGWTTSDGEKDPYAITARQFAKALEEVAPGAFEVKYYPNRQLGDEKEMLEGLSFGTLDVGVITNAVIANVAPSFQLNDMPFLYSSEEQAHEVLDGEVGQKLLSDLEAKKIIGLGFAEGGFRHMINNVRPVTEPADVEGVKYRVMQNPIYIEMFKSLGGNAVPMAWGEVYTAVQQGTIDGLEIPVAVIESNKYPEVTQYLSLTKHTYSALGLLMSAKTWDKLSEDEQKAVRKAASMAIKAEREIAANNVKELIGQIESEGMKVNEVEDVAAFRAKVKPVYDQFRDQIGADVLDKTLKQVDGDS